MSIESKNNNKLDISKEIKDINKLKTQIEDNKEIIEWSDIIANFELLNDANMPDGIKRYRITKESVNGNKINWTDIMGNFFECSVWSVDLALVQDSKISDHFGDGLGNKVWIAMPLPFVGDKWTEWITMLNGTIYNKEKVNYRGDNALVWFKDGKSWIIKIKVWDNNKQKNYDANAKIVAQNQSDESRLAEVMEPRNGYTICQQMSIMDNGNKSCEFVWQSISNQKDWWGRRYRFFVETNNGTTWVVDFKEDITINQAISIMKRNSIKNAVYADIIAYNIYFADKDGNVYTREEWNDWESSYEKVIDKSKVLPNKNILIIKWK